MILIDRLIKRKIRSLPNTELYCKHQPELCELKPQYHHSVIRNIIHTACVVVRDPRSLNDSADGHDRYQPVAMVDRRRQGDGCRPCTVVFGLASASQWREILSAIPAALSAGVTRTPRGRPALTTDRTVIAYWRSFGFG